MPPPQVHTGLRQIIFFLIVGLFSKANPVQVFFRYTSTLFLFAPSVFSGSFLSTQVNARTRLPPSLAEAPVRENTGESTGCHHRQKTQREDLKMAMRERPIASVRIKSSFGA